MSLIALNRQLLEAYAKSITCECKGTVMLSRPDQTIGVNAKNTQLTELGVVCDDTIVWRCLNRGWRTFGRLLKTFQKSQPQARHVDQTQQNLGQKTTSIGKSQEVLRKITKSTCGNGIKNPDSQTLSITPINIFASGMAFRWGGITKCFPNRMMSVQSASSQKLLLSEAR